MAAVISHLLAVPYQDVLLLMRAPATGTTSATNSPGSDERETWKTFYNITSLPDLVQDVGCRRRWRRPTPRVRSTTSSIATRSPDVTIPLSTAPPAPTACSSVATAFRHQCSCLATSSSHCRLVSCPSPPVRSCLFPSSARMPYRQSADVQARADDIIETGRRLRQIADCLQRDKTLRCNHSNDHHHHHLSPDISEQQRPLLRRQGCRCGWGRMMRHVLFGAILYQLSRTLMDLLR